MSEAGEAQAIDAADNIVMKFSQAIRRPLR